MKFVRTVTWQSALCAVVLALAPPVIAQSVGGAGRHQPRSVDVEAVVRPAYLISDVDIIQAHLGLDEGQRVVVDTLFEDFNEAFTSEVQQLRVALQQSQPGALSGGTVEGLRSVQSRYEEQLGALRQELSRELRAAGSADERKRLRDEFAVAMERLTQEQAAVESRSGNESSWEEFLLLQAELLEQWLERRQAMEEELLMGVELVLEPEQLERWTRAQQAIHSRGLPSENELGGEGIDLAARVRNLDLDPVVMEAIEPSLQAYADAIDEPARLRASFLLQAVPATSAALAASDWVGMKQIIQREVEHRAAVRDVNLQWFETMLEVLPEPHRTQLRDGIRRYAFGSVWDAGRADRIFEAALQRDDLTESERSRLERARIDCQASRAPLQLRRQASVVQEAPARWVRDQERRWAPSFSNGEFEPNQEQASDSRAIRDELNQVEQQCADGISELLGEERYLQLPGTQQAPRRSGEGRRGDRSAESIRRRDELYKRFDSNGDGQLDADERRRMRDTLQNERRRP